MLSNPSPHSTPKRPLPPAKMRRRPPSQPPPPYDVARRGPEQDAFINEKPQPLLDQWMNEKSREELSDLLLAAGGMIKDRETELGLTSALCKNLYEENFSLKSKHDALLARIPTQLGQSISPLPSPTRALSPLPPTTPRNYSISRPCTPSASGSPSSPALSLLSDRSRPRHTRRISVTPSDLTYLADQNAELMQKLEKLEEESTQADLQGKRKLRKLEKEIGLLKEELEKTREKGVELEERVMKKVSGMSAEEEDEKRKQREERVKALRRKSVGEEEVQKPVLNFAPAPELPKAKLSVPAPIPEEASVDVQTTESTRANVSDPCSEAYAQSATTLVSPSTSVASCLPASLSRTHPLEYAIIAQLLHKIRELEDTNAQIFAAQKATSDRLNAAQQEAETIKRAYDCLDGDDDEVEVWVVPDEDLDELSFDAGRRGVEEDAASTYGSPLNSLRVPTGQTIRFSSLRRTIEGDASRLALLDDPQDDFANGVVMQSTTRGVFGLDAGDSPRKSQKQHAGRQKSRKTVMDLFNSAGNETEEEEELLTSANKYPPRLHVSPSLRGLSPIPICATGMPSDPADVSIWSNSATDNDPPRSSDSASPVSEDESVYASPLPPTVGFNLPDSRSSSPSPSGVSSWPVSPAPSTLGIGGALHTLGSELGSEFGDDWNERAGNHHLRATSLCNMSADMSMESSGSVPGEWIADGGEDHPPIPEIDIESEDDHARVTSGTSTAIARSVSGGSASGSATPSGTPTKSHFSFHSRLQPHVVIQPPTPSPKSKIGAKVAKSSRSRSRSSLRISSSQSMPGDVGVGTALEEDKLTKANSRNARLSQTVRARTSRWAERRYARYAELPPPPLSPVLSPTLSNVPFPTSEDFAVSDLGLVSVGPRARRSTMQARRAVRAPEMRRRTASTASTAMEKMDESFEEAVHRVSRSISFSASGSSVDMVKFKQLELNFDCSDTEPEREEIRDQRVRPAKPTAPTIESQIDKKSHTGFVGFVLEVWLWLQFAIVVLVFLWAMARRGPKSVLEDAERSHRQSQRR